MHFKWVWRELRGKALAGGRKLLSGCKFVFIIIVVGLFVARFVWYKYIEISAACFFFVTSFQTFFSQINFLRNAARHALSNVVLCKLNK
jgi:hypothetical protein